MGQHFESDRSQFRHEFTRGVAEFFGCLENSLRLTPTENDSRLGSQLSEINFRRV